MMKYNAVQIKAVSLRETALPVGYISRYLCSHVAALIRYRLQLPWCSLLSQEVLQYDLELSQTTYHEQRQHGG